MSMQDDDEPWTPTLTRVDDKVFFEPAEAVAFIAWRDPQRLHSVPVPDPKSAGSLLSRPHNTLAYLLSIESPEGAKVEKAWTALHRALSHGHVRAVGIDLAVSRAQFQPDGSHGKQQLIDAAEWADLDIIYDMEIDLIGRRGIPLYQEWRLYADGVLKLSDGVVVSDGANEELTDLEVLVIEAVETTKPQIVKIRGYIKLIDSKIIEYIKDKTNRTYSGGHIRKTRKELLRRGLIDI